MVRMHEQVLLRTTFPLAGFFTCLLASTILIGRVLCRKSPRIPPTASVATAQRVTMEKKKYGMSFFGFLNWTFTFLYSQIHNAMRTKNQINTKGCCITETPKTLNRFDSCCATCIAAIVRRV